MGLAQLERAAIAGRERRVLAVAAAMPDRTHGMDDMPRWQPVSLGDLGVAGGAAAEGAALREQFRPGGAVDRAVDPAAAEQRLVRGVDDGINAERGDVGGDDLEPGRTDLARGQRQAEAGAAAVTPFSAKSCCSSPA